MIKGFLFFVLLSVLTLPADRHALAEAGDDLSELKKEVETLKQGQLQLQRELEEINALLRRHQPSTDVRYIVRDYAVFKEAIASLLPAAPGSGSQ